MTDVIHQAIRPLSLIGFKLVAHHAIVGID
jgi:hypothetical protein